MSRLRTLAKKCIDYTIEGEEKVYRLKHTPFAVRKVFTKNYHKHYENLPVQKNKIIFDNYKGGGFGCNCKYVLLELLRQKVEADYVWMLRNPSEAEGLPKGVRTVSYGSRQAMEEYATAGFWVNNFQMTYYLNHGLLKKPEQCYIQMWHGSFGIKKIEADCNFLNENQPWHVLARKNAAYTDYWISNSAFETQVYKDAFWGAENILEYGHPRNDIFFIDMKPVGQSVRRRYGIEGKRVLLYVPTFRDLDEHRVLLPDYESVLESLKKRFGGEWIFAVRNHPRVAEKIEKVSGKSLVDVTDYPDIQELLAAADAVLTDYSSAVFDFVLTGKPGFLLVEDYEEYENLRGLYYPPEESPFPVARSREQLCSLIEQFDENRYREDVQRFLREKGSVEDGSASEKVAALIQKTMERKEKSND